jgi:type II secretory pathway component PulF
MPTFAYQARDAKGERTTGAQEATDQRAALEALRAAGLFVTKLEVTKSGLARNGAGSTPAVANAPATSIPIPTAPARNSTPEISPSRLSPSTSQPSVENNALPPRVAATNTDAPLLPHYFLRSGSKDMALFFQQLHAMLNAGTSLAHALNTMATNAPNSSMRTACADKHPRESSGTHYSE